MLLLCKPPTVTRTGPDVALAGTVVAIDVADHVDAVAVMPLNVTVDVPWVAPKFDPVNVTFAPTTPVVMLRLVKTGAAVTVNVTALL
jgi:hypothetical protein